MTHPFARTHAHADNYWLAAQVTKIISLKCTRNRKHVDFITFECFDKWETRSATPLPREMEAVEEREGRGGDGKNSSRWTEKTPPRQ